MLESIVAYVKKLSSLKVNDPNTRIIKLFAKYFAGPVTHMFNEYFARQIFPDISEGV